MSAAGGTTVQPFVGIQSLFRRHSEHRIMINDFLSDILKVVIVLDVLGVIAYFLLGLNESPRIFRSLG